MPAVGVTLENERTGERRSGVTGGLGRMTFAFLQPGAYQITCARPGFETSNTGNLHVGLAETALVTVSMQVGNQTQTVVVTGVAEMARTDSPALGRVTDGKVLASLPLATRNYVQALTLSPGITASVSNAGQLGQGAGLPVVEGTSDGIFAHGA